MTGPQEPEDPDWGFPEVDPAGPTSTPNPTPTSTPTSTQLPEPETPAYDTGSDAWWRAQAEGQRAAAAADSAGATPLDEGWLPPELAEPEPAEPEPPSAPPVPEPVPAPAPAYARPPTTAPAAPAPVPEPAAQDVTDPVGIPPVVAAPAWAVAEPAVHEAEEPQDRAPAPAERVGPGRAAAGAAIAVAGVALGIGALLLLGGNDGPKGGPAVALPSVTAGASATAPATPSPTAAGSPAASAAPAPVAPAQAPVVPVSVLNNSRISGLASRAAARFRAAGWPVAVQGNYSGGIISTTTVYYAPGQQASAERFAREFGISRVAPRFRGLPTQGMTVVLTRDYRG